MARKHARDLTNFTRTKFYALKSLVVYARLMRAFFTNFAAQNAYALKTLVVYARLMRTFFTNFVAQKFCA